MGSTDAQKLDQYFTSVRALEVQLAAIPSAACSQGTRPGTIAAGDFQTIIEAQMDLMTLAFQCDLTRAISFNFGAGHCDHFYSFLPGITDIHHSLSHNGGDQGKRAQLTTIEAWELSMLARFWNGLKAIPEGDGTALDNTVTLVSSELADGDLHNYQNLGVLSGGQRRWIHQSWPQCPDRHEQHLRQFDLRMSRHLAGAWRSGHKLWRLQYHHADESFDLKQQRAAAIAYQTPLAPGATGRGRRGPRINAGITKEGRQP